MVIEDYFCFFERNLCAVESISHPAFRKVLIFAMLERLAKGRYHTVLNSKKRFMCLLRNDCDWKDARRVSILQSRDQLSAGAVGLSDALKEAINGYQFPIGRGTELDIDPTYDELLPYTKSEKDKEFLLYNRHDQLLYACRSSWVHEFSEPASELLPDAEDEPRYQVSSMDVEGPVPGDDALDELVHPAGFLAKLTRQALSSLREYYERECSDPFLRYTQGPLLRPIFGQKNPP